MLKPPTSIRLWRGATIALVALVLQVFQPVLAVQSAGTAARLLSFDNQVSASICTTGHDPDGAQHHHHEGHPCALCQICYMAQAVLASETVLPLPVWTLLPPAIPYRLPPACGPPAARPRARGPPNLS